MKEVFIPYSDNVTELEGFVAYPSEKKSPLVLLCHGWRGKDDFICEKARLIASWGYVAFALDMYGKGIVGKSREENAKLKAPFFEDRSFLQRRALLGLEIAKSLPYVNSEKIATVGFGFGGTCSLDLARSGASLNGAVSIYGHLDPPPASLIKPIQAKILVLQGYDDPIISQTELHCFEKEMNDQRVDWQVHLYGGTFHAFLIPGIDVPSSGLLHNPVAEKRSLLSICHFLDEVLLD